jgi:hypothetical protein
MNGWQRTRRTSSARIARQARGASHACLEHTCSIQARALRRRKRSSCSPSGVAFPYPQRCTRARDAMSFTWSSFCVTGAECMKLHSRYLERNHSRTMKTKRRN